MSTVGPYLPAPDAVGQPAAIDISRKPWLSPTEAAEYLSLSTVKALRRRVERGAVPPWCWTKFGGSLRFSRAALDQLLSGVPASKR